MGLRETKKRRARAEIQQAALELVRERGLEASTVREIAQRSGVSPATFFNYFPSKDALLGSWLRESAEAALRAAESRSAGRSLRHWVRELVREWAPAVAEDAPLWRRASARAGLEPVLCAAAVERLRAAAQAEEIRADVPPEELAELFAATLLATTAAALATGSESEGELRAPIAPRLLRALELVLDGCRKRHERVRVPVPRDPKRAPPPRPI